MAQDNDKLVITPHADGVARLAFSPDGRYVAFSPVQREEPHAR
jgi:Tol biopolymer transport system component